MSKTRNQRKRDVLEHLIASVAAMAILAVACVLLCGMMCQALEHPAEQPITYEQHIQRGGVSDALYG